MAGILLSQARAILKTVDEIKALEYRDQLLDMNMISQQTESLKRRMSVQNKVRETERPAANQGEKDEGGADTGRNKGSGQTVRHAEATVATGDSTQLQNS